MRYEIHDDMGLVRRYDRKQDAERHAAQGGGLFIVKIKTPRKPSAYQQAMATVGEGLF